MQTAVTTLLLAGASLLWNAAAQEPSGASEGKPLGFVLDSKGKRIRSIGGRKEHASFGTDMEIAADSHAAYVDPQQKYALVESGEKLVLADWSAAKPEVRDVPNLGPLPEFVGFSPTGDMVALYFKQGRRIQVWTGFPAKPTIAKRLLVPALYGEVTALAISDDGGAAAVATTTGDVETLVLIADGKNRKLISGGDYTAITFLRGSRFLAVADRSDSSVVMLAVGKDNVEVASSTLASETQGVDQPIALAFSEDSQKLVVAGPNSVTVVDIPTKQGLTVDVPHRPDGLFPTSEGLLFRLTSSCESEVLLFDGSAREPRIIKVGDGVPGSELTSAVGQLLF